MRPLKRSACRGALIALALASASAAEGAESARLRVLLGLDCVVEHEDGTASYQQDCAKPKEYEPERRPGVGRVILPPLDPPIRNLRQVDLDAVDASSFVYDIFEKAGTVPDSYRVPCLRSYVLPPDLQGLAPAGYRAAVMLNDNGKDLDELDRHAKQSKGAFGVLFLPQDRARPAIFASKGTVTLTDWKNNLDRAPIDYIERLYGKSCGEDSFFSYLEKYVQTQGSVVITGHSQGGAVAQIIGKRLGAAVLADAAPGPRVQLARGRPAKAPGPVKALGIRPKGYVHVVTFNALGGEKSELIFLTRVFGEGLAKILLKATVGPDAIRNYHLAGDPVFGLAPQIGPGILVPTEELDEPSFSLQAHSIATISKAMHTDFRALRRRLAAEAWTEIAEAKLHKDAMEDLRRSSWAFASHEVERDKLVEEAKARVAKLKQIDAFLEVSSDGQPLEDIYGAPPSN